MGASRVAETTPSPLDPDVHQDAHSPVVDHEIRARLPRGKLQPPEGWVDPPQVGVHGLDRPPHGPLDVPGTSRSLGRGDLGKLSLVLLLQLPVSLLRDLPLEQSGLEPLDPLADPIGVHCL